MSHFRNEFMEIFHRLVNVNDVCPISLKNLEAGISPLVLDGVEMCPLMTNG